MYFIGFILWKNTWIVRSICRERRARFISIFEQVKDDLPKNVQDELKYLIESTDPTDHDDDSNDEDNDSNDDGGWKFKKPSFEV